MSSNPSMRRERRILATTDLVDAYGGTQLSAENLAWMAEALKSEQIPMRQSHDASKPLNVENVDAEVVQRTDGQHELWVEFDVEEEAWARFLAEAQAAGQAGGLSFTLVTVIEQIETPALLGLQSIAIAADAHHFSFDEVLTAAKELAQAGPVKAGRLYQFSAVPAAVVFVQFVLQAGAQIPPGIASAWLYDALKRFLPLDKPAPAVQLEVTGPDGRKVSACIHSGTDPSIAKKAIEAFETWPTSQASTNVRLMVPGASSKASNPLASRANEAVGSAGRGMTLYVPVADNAN